MAIAEDKSRVRLMVAVCGDRLQLEISQKGQRGVAGKKGPDLKGRPGSRNCAVKDELIVRIVIDVNNLAIGPE